MSNIENHNNDPEILNHNLWHSKFREACKNYEQKVSSIENGEEIDLDYYRAIFNMFAKDRSIESQLQEIKDLYEELKTVEGNMFTAEKVKNDSKMFMETLSSLYDYAYNMHLVRCKKLVELKEVLDEGTELGGIGIDADCYQSIAKTLDDISLVSKGMVMFRNVSYEPVRKQIYTWTNDIYYGRFKGEFGEKKDFSYLDKSKEKGEEE